MTFLLDIFFRCNSTGEFGVWVKALVDDLGTNTAIRVDRPGFWGRPVRYIGVFNFRYTVFLYLKLGMKYSLTTNFGYKVYRAFLNFGILLEL